MSVTFWCPAAPTETVVPYPDMDPEYTETRSVLPEVGLSNSNARMVIYRLDLPLDCPTSISGHTEEPAEVVGRIDQALNQATLLRDEYLQRVLPRLRELFLKASEAHYQVVWG